MSSLSGANLGAGPREQRDLGAAHERRQRDTHSMCVASLCVREQWPALAPLTDNLDDYNGTCTAAYHLLAEDLSFRAEAFRAVDEAERHESYGLLSPLLRRIAAKAGE